MMPGRDALVLEILRQDNMLKMGVFEHRETVPTLRYYSLCPVSFSEVSRLCQEITAALNRAAKRSEPNPALINDLRKAGRLLWDQLFSRPVKDKLRPLHGLDLILSIDEELVNIPWELLYDGNNFLCLKFNIGRLIRTREQTAAPQYRSCPSTLKMLILANPTNDLRSAYLEGIQIKNQFDRNRDKINIHFKSTDIDTLYVKKNLGDYDIVHFAGHCEYNPHNDADTGWVLSDGKLTAGDVLKMGESTSLPTLVFSNACQSAGFGPELTDADCQEKNYSLASSFLFSGVRHYIGSIRKIEDPVSLSFAREFYSQLILGRAVGECLRQARLKLVREYGISGMFWASYLLYGDPTFVLFRVRAKPPLSVRKTIIAHKKTLVILLASLLMLSIGLYLYPRLPSLNPRTYVLFAQSQNLFKQGDNQKVILLGNRIINQDPMFLAVYPLLADSYLRLGDMERALQYYFDYCLYSEKRHDNKNLASAYIGLGWVYQLRGEYPKAYDLYNKAITLSIREKDALNEARALRKLAVWHIDKKDYSQALELLTKSSEINRQRQRLEGYRYNLACDYFDIGLVFANKNDFKSAKEFYNKSRLLLERMKLRSELSDCYFNLGEIYLFEKEYQKALDYYMKGLKIDQAQGNKVNMAGDHNMLGELYLEMDDLDAAESSLKEALILSKQVNARPNLADAYYNLGLLYKKKNQKNKAREYLRNAQEIYGIIDPAGYEEAKKEILSLTLP